MEITRNAQLVTRNAQLATRNQKLKRLINATR
jgi:tetrahydromethanopterin S-methyltransferase subunit F